MQPCWAWEELSAAGTAAATAVLSRQSLQGGQMCLCGALLGPMVCLLLRRRRQLHMYILCRNFLPRPVAAR